MVKYFVSYLISGSIGHCVVKLESEIKDEEDVLKLARLLKIENDDMDSVIVNFIKL